jgi:RNA exonuclease 1
VLEGVIGALDSHEFVFARLMALADALGCTWALCFLLAIFDLELTRSFLLSGVTPKTGAESGVGSENPETSRNNTIPIEKANHAAVATDTDIPPSPPTALSPSQNQKDNVLFSAVTDLNAQLTTLHAALPPRTAFLLFSGHSDPRSMSALAAQRAQYQAQTSQNQNQNQGNTSAAGVGTGTGPAGTDVSVPLRWSTADERALEEAVVRARTGLLFVGVKT